MDGVCERSIGRTPPPGERAVPLAVALLSNRDARIGFEAIRRGDPSACFAREIMSHERMFFVKTPARLRES